MSEIQHNLEYANSQLGEYLRRNEQNPNFAKRVISGGNKAENPDLTLKLVETGMVAETGYTLDVVNCYGAGLVGLSKNGRYLCYPIHISSQGAVRQTEETGRLIAKGVSTFLQTPGLDFESVKPFIGGGINSFMGSGHYKDGLNNVIDLLKKGGIAIEPFVFAPNTSREIGNLFMGENKVLWVTSRK